MAIDWSNGLVCSVCRKDIASAGYCLDGVLYCPACSWHAEAPIEQLALFDEASA